MLVVLISGCKEGRYTDKQTEPLDPDGQTYRRQANEYIYIPKMPTGLSVLETFVLNERNYLRQYEYVGGRNELSVTGNNGTWRDANLSIVLSAEICWLKAIEEFNALVQNDESGQVKVWSVTPVYDDDLHCILLNDRLIM